MKMQPQPKADKPLRATPAGSLLSQWWTTGTLVRDRRTSGRHMKVAWVIIDRFMQAKGDARASLRYIETFTGLNRHAVISACRELTEWGYVTRRLGAGTRPSEYTPNWVTERSSGVDTLTSNANCSSGAETLTSSGEQNYTTRAASGVETLTESYLLEPAYRPASQEVEDPDAAPSAPVAAGLAPALPVTAQGDKEREPLSGFDELWSAYGWKQQRVKARAAYTKLSPDTATHSAMVDAAAAWGGHYVEHNTEPRWRVMLHNWIAGEKWKDDLPIVQADAKSAAISQIRGSAKPKGAAKGKAEPSRVVRIVSATDVGSFFDEAYVDLKIVESDGRETERQLHIASQRGEYGDGPDRATYHALCRAAAVTGNTSELVGRSVLMGVAADGSLTFSSPGDDRPAAEQAA